MRLNIIVLLLLAAMSLACASKQKNSVTSEFLATHIRNDDSKAFQYSVVLNHADGRGGKNVGGGMRMSGGSSSNTRAYGGVTVGNSKGGGKGGKGGGKNTRGKPLDRLNEELDKLLADMMSREDYCRDGWMEIERDYQPPNHIIRGECNESASAKDREKFPNSKDS